MIARYVLLFLFLNVSLVTVGKQSVYIKIYTVKDGLNNSNVYDILEDKNGFLWMLSLPGNLNRFDGFQFKNFDLRLGGKSVSQHIRHMVTDSMGRIWIAKDDELICYDENQNLSTNRWNDVIKGSNYFIFPNYISLDKNRIWCGGHGGVFRYNLNQNKLTHFPLTELGISKSVKFVEAFNSSAIWIGTNDGIALVAHKDKELIPIEYIEVPNDEFRYYKDKKEQVWSISNQKLTCYSYVEGAGVQQIYSMSQEEAIKLSGKDLEFKSIIQISDEQYWLGTARGIYIYEPGTKKLEQLQFFDIDNNNLVLAENLIRGFYQDREGNIWIRAKNKGVAKYNPHNQFIKKHLRSGKDIRAICEDKEGNVWLGFAFRGLEIIDYKTDKSENIRVKGNDWEQKSLDHIREIYQDKDNQIWIGSLEGLRKVKKNGGRYSFEVYKNVNGHFLGGIYAMLHDSKNRLWIGTTQGLFKCDDGLESLQAVSPWDIDEDNKFMVRCISEDHDGTIWVGTEANGIFHFDKDTVHTYNSQSGLKSHKIFALHIDSKKTVWIASLNGLSYKLHGSKQFQAYENEHLQTSRIIYSIQEDNNRNLWLSSSQGIISIDLKNNHLKNYLTGFEFSDDAWFKNDEGEIFMGGTPGFVSFNPDEKVLNPHQPKLVFNGLRINNQFVNMGDSINERILLTQNLSDLDSLHLKHNENFFTIDLLGISLSNVKQIRYQYRLKNFENNWVKTTSNDRKAIYTNVPHGEYTLEFKACNEDGVWSDIKELEIIIQPAFYQTQWFKFLLILTIVLLIVTIVWLRIRSLHQQKIHLEEEVAEKTQSLQKQNKAIEKQNREIIEQRDQLVELTGIIRKADEQKMKFFTNISHEIRTPLTLISGPADHLIEISKKDDPRYKGLKSIQRNSNLILKLISQLLDISKIDSGYMDVKPVTKDLSELVNEIYDSFVANAQNKTMQIEIVPGNYTCNFDVDMVHKILNNLLSNAMKFAPEKGEVSLKMENTGENIRISVLDNGPGIPKEEQSKIFKRFYQSAGKERKVGSGIGLALSRELALLHGGDIKLHSEYGNGSCFELILPYREEEIEIVELIKEQVDNQPLNNVSKDLSVLVIEDHEDLRSFIIDGIEAETIWQAKNGEEGFQRAIENSPDIIISDVLMPKMNGFEFCKKIKEDNRTNHIPVILLTALGADEHQQIGIDMGADDYIIKPFNYRVLSGKIQNVIRSRNRLKELLQTGKEELNEYETWKQKMPLFMKALLDVIEENLAESKFGVVELAERMNMSRTTLYRKLKNITDKTAVEFIREVRIRKALELLHKDPTINISELSIMVGIENADYFRKCFKQQFGKTPKEMVSTFNS